MNKLTGKTESGHFYIEESSLAKVEEGYTGEAADRLARFETMCEQLDEEQKAISTKLDKLRLEGKTNTYQFRELMSKKLTNTALFSVLKLYGLHP